MKKNHFDKVVIEMSSVCIESEKCDPMRIAMIDSLDVICLYSTETIPLSFDYEEENSFFLSDSFAVRPPRHHHA